jgi:hypothetical protein
MSFMLINVIHPSTISRREGITYNDYLDNFDNGSSNKYEKKILKIKKNL